MSPPPSHSVPNGNQKIIPESKSPTKNFVKNPAIFISSLCHCYLQGSDRLFAVFIDTFNSTFDKLESYLLKNIFHIPSNVVLPEDQVCILCSITITFDKLESYLLKNIFHIPSNVVLPEDQVCMLCNTTITFDKLESCLLKNIFHIPIAMLYCLKIRYVKTSKKINSYTYFFASKIKANFVMTKQVVWVLREFFFLQFAFKQLILGKIGTILWLLLSTQISQVWHTTRWDENAKCGMRGLERPLRISATQCLRCVWPYTAVQAILTITCIEDEW